MTNEDLKAVEFNSYYGRYIYKLSNETSLRDGFKKGHAYVLNFFDSIPEEKLTYCYESDKWNPKEILQHLVDTERIFMYRCFRIARNDKTPMAGFDQNIYMNPSQASNKPLDDLKNEFSTTRASSIALLQSLTDSDLKCIGDANGGNMSARAAAFTIIGHDIWHMDIIKEIYL